MTDSELLEIKEAINAAKQYSEDKPSGRYERLLIACIPILKMSIMTSSPAYGLSIARAINSASFNAL